MNPSVETRTDRCVAILMILLVMSCIPYLALPNRVATFSGLAAVYSLQFALYFGLAWRVVWSGQGGRVPLALGVLAALACRAILIPSAPVLENDYWRYLWDGRVLIHGINPYRYAPLDPALGWLDIGYRHLIGWPRFKTIYPPLAELLFALSQWIARNSVVALKCVLVAFDLGTGWILYRWLLVRSQKPTLCLLYLLNPLVLKEIANSSHLDSIVVFFMLGALYVFSSMPHRKLWAWILLALAVASKLYPLVLLPLFLRLDKRWKAHLSAFVLTLAALYGPFIGRGVTLFGGAQAYAKYWIWNAGIFQITKCSVNWMIRHLVSVSPASPFALALTNDYPAKLVLGTCFMGGLLWQQRRLKPEADIARESLWILGLLLVLSPVVDSWYVLWLLPLACLTVSVPWIAFSYLVIASYAWFLGGERVYVLRIAEYVMFFSLLAWDFLRAGYTLQGSKGSSLPLKPFP